jgi:hypothetical protein
MDIYMKKKDIFDRIKGKNIINVTIKNDIKIRNIIGSLFTSGI